MPPDDPQTPPPEPPPDPPKPAEPDTAAAKRERQTHPIRVLAKRPDGGWDLAPSAPSFDTIAKAERWVMSEGADGATFLLARIIGGPRTVEPRKVTEGAL